MAEDLYIMAYGEAEVYVPEILWKDGDIQRPRCPMIKEQFGSQSVNMGHIHSSIINSHVSSSSIQQSEDSQSCELALERYHSINTMKKQLL